MFVPSLTITTIFESSKEGNKQSALVDHGEYYISAASFDIHIVEDGRLITRQNPASAEDIAVKMIEHLKSKTSKS